MKTLSTRWAHFTRKEQNAFLALSPFQGRFYYDYRSIKDYLVPLQDYHQIDSDPFTDFYPILQSGIETGVFQQADGDLAFMNCHPIFRFFLQKKASSPPIKKQLQTLFQQYYKAIAKDLYDKLKSGEPEYYQEALMVLDYEYPNLIEATWNAIEENEDIIIFTSVLDTFFTHHQRLLEQLSFGFHLKKRLDELVEKPHFTTYISILDSIGNTLLHLRQPKEAKQVFLEALELCEQADSSNERVERMKGALYSNIGNCVIDSQERIVWQEKSFQIAKRLEGSRLLGKVAYNLSEAFFEIRNLEQSHHYLKIAMESFMETGDLHHQIKAFQSLSTHWQVTKDYDKAAENLNLALMIAENLQDVLQQGIILQEKAALYFLRKESREAIAFCKNAIALFINAGDIRQQANAYNLLCTIAFEEDDLVDGMSYAEKALMLFQQAEDFSQMAQTYTNIAITCYRLHWFEECNVELKKAMQLYDEIGDRYHLEKCRILFASAFFGIEDFEKGKSELLLALIYFVEVKDNEEIQHCLNLANFISAKKEDEKFEQDIRSLTKQINSNE